MATTGQARNKPRLGSSIAFKLLASMVFIALVPLVGAVVISNAITSTRLTEQTGQSVREVATTTADLVAQTLTENVHLLESLADVAALTQSVERANAGYSQAEAGISSRLEAREAEWLATSTYSQDVLDVISDDVEVNLAGHEIHRFQRRFERSAQIIVADRHGGLLAATSRPPNFSFANEEWWLRATDRGQVFIGRPTHDPATDVISLKLAAPVRDAGGEVLGAIYWALNVSEIKDILDDVKLGDTGILHIYDGNGEALFDPSMSSLAVGRLPAELEAAEITTAASPGWLATEARVHGYAKAGLGSQVPAVASLGWTTVASQDAEEALGPVTAAQLLQFLTLGVAALVAVVLAVVTTRVLTRQIGHITRLLEDVRQGKYTSRAKVESQDELGAMTTTLNTLMDEILHLIQSQEERDRIQGAIMKLLEEISDVAQGDLTVEAQVTADVTGAIADSFNFMIMELRQIIAQVQETTGQVSTSALQIRGRMERLAEGSQFQASQIVDTSGEIRSMADSIQEVSRNAEVCSQVAEESLANARRGTDAVVQMVHGMESIRGQVQESSRRMKRLGESSQEIGEIVKLIGEIADRTSILALNASIQAATAGEAGRGFTVVADEVERLAERAVESTSRINTLIKTVQAETAEAVAAMEDTTREVVGGSELARQAGRSLQEIQSVSQRLAELVQTISQAAARQAVGSDVVAKSMNQISGITQQAAAGNRQAASAMDGLTELADQLRTSVDRFRLPGEKPGAVLRQLESA